jgi:hypothetical protein
VLQRATNLFCPVDKNLGVLASERWYWLEQLIKINTRCKADGVIHGWVDGKLAYEKANMIDQMVLAPIGPLKSLPLQRLGS